MCYPSAKAVNEELNNNMENKKDIKNNGEGAKACACLSCHDHGSMHGGMCCCCHGGGRFSILRIVIGVLLLIFVFWFGVKVGEVKSLFYGGYQGRSMMMRYGYENMGGGYGVPMGGAPGSGGEGSVTSTANSN